MPSSRWTSACFIPDSTFSRMSRTTALLRTELGRSSPLAYFRRPFEAQSRTLSACVPRNRWPGFTQDGLSQWWQTNSPSGIGPLVNCQETRWAYISLRVPSVLDPALKAPYPVLNFPVCHSQQPVPVETLLQNLAIALASTKTAYTANGWRNASPGGWGSARICRRMPLPRNNIARWVRRTQPSALRGVVSWTRCEAGQLTGLRVVRPGVGATEWRSR